MDEAKAWGEYWTQMGASGGCLPGAPQVVAAMLADQWRDFAKALGSGARLIDLACGTGAVLRELHIGNDALDLTGVDFAPLPDATGAPFALVGECRIEELPFPDSHFDAATSQFGIEYADEDASIGELARVTKQDAMLRFVIHHRNSPIIAQNMRRLAALKACQRSNASAVAASSGATLRAIKESLVPIARQFPEQAVVAEIGAALDEARQMRPTRRKQDIARIEMGMDREISTLSALDRAAKDETGIGCFAQRLSDSFSDIAAKPMLVGGEVRPIAWLVTAKRSR